MTHTHTHTNDTQEFT